MRLHERSSSQSLYLEGIYVLFDHGIIHLRAETEWLGAVLDKLEKGLRRATIVKHRHIADEEWVEFSLTAKGVE